MAERRQCSSKSVYFNSLLKIWDLESDGIDRKTLLETGGHSLMQCNTPQLVASRNEREADIAQRKELAATGGSCSELKAVVQEHDVVMKVITGTSSVVLQLPACTVNGNKMLAGASPTDKISNASVLPFTSSDSRPHCCLHCGHQNNPSSNWCIECGTALIGSSPEAGCWTHTGNKVRLRQTEGNSGEPVETKGNRDVQYGERDATCCTDLDLSESGLCQLLPHTCNLRYGSGTSSTWNHSSALTQCGVLNECDPHHGIQCTTDPPQKHLNRHLQKECNITDHVNGLAVNVDPPRYHLKNSSVAGPLVDCKSSSPTTEEYSRISGVKESAHRSHRHWDTSGVYMWKKPSTIRSRKVTTLVEQVSVPLQQHAEDIHQSHRTVADEIASQDSLQNSAGSCQHAVHNSSIAASPQNLEWKWSDSFSGPSLFLLALPDELLLAVLSFLSHHDLSSCMLVCWKMHSIASDPSLWRSISLWKKYSITDNILLSVVRKHPQAISFCHCKGGISVRALQVFFQGLSSQLQVLLVDTCDFGPHTGDMLLTSAALHCPNLCSIGIKWTQLSERAFIYSVQHCSSCTADRLIHSGECHFSLSLTMCNESADSHCIHQLVFQLALPRLFVSTQQEGKSTQTSPPRLEEVCLEQIPDISLQSVKQLVECHGKWLKTLTLKGTPSTLGEAVVNLCAKNQVATLILFSATFTRVDKHIMQQLTEAFPNLRRLEIYCTSISEEASFLLSHMALESLVLMSLLPLTAASVAHIGQIHTLKSIKYPQQNF